MCVCVFIQRRHVCFIWTLHNSTLSGIVAMIMMRALHRDFRRYNRDDNEEDDAIEVHTSFTNQSSFSLVLSNSQLKWHNLWSCRRLVGNWSTQMCSGRLLGQCFWLSQWALVCRLLQWLWSQWVQSTSPFLSSHSKSLMVVVLWFLESLLCLGFCLLPTEVVLWQPWLFLWWSWGMHMHTHHRTKTLFLKFVCLHTSLYMWQDLQWVLCLSYL